MKNQTIGGLALAAALAMSAGAASAVTVSNTVNIAGSGEVRSVGYTGINVTSGGYFNIFTQTSDIDPEIFLFADTNGNGHVDAGEALIANNDDGCASQSYCGPGATFWNSTLHMINLAAGRYVAAVGDYNLTEAEARSGINNSDSLGVYTGQVTVVVDSSPYGQRGGVAEIAPIPLPAAGFLLLAGLGGLAVFGRRKA